MMTSRGIRFAADEERTKLLDDIDDNYEVRQRLKTLPKSVKVNADAFLTTGPVLRQSKDIEKTR